MNEILKLFLGSRKIEFIEALADAGYCIIQIEQRLPKGRAA